MRNVVGFVLRNAFGTGVRRSVVKRHEI
jgi:hypothetical protein